MTGLDAGIRRLYRSVAGIGLPVMVGGSIAAIFNGEPRATLDIDMVIDAQETDAERIAAAFDPGGFSLPPLAVIRSEIRKGTLGHFTIIDFLTGMKADIYPAGDDPLIRSGLEHIHPFTVGDDLLHLAPPSDVIAMKLGYFSMRQQDKHLRDIRNILAMSRPDVDMDLVAVWARRVGASTQWQECQDSIGEE